MQYKELIRAQDQRISQISQGNLYLQQELTIAKAQIEELNTTIQTLQDQNSLIKAQKTCNGPTSEVVVPNNAKHFEVKIVIYYNDMLRFAGFFSRVELVEHNTLAKKLFTLA